MLETNNQLNWNLDELVPPTSQNEGVQAAMQTLTLRLVERSKGPVMVVKDFIVLAVKSVEKSELLRVAEDK